MTRLPIYQVDAFTGRVFAGNPAAVCPLERWLDERLMLAIAAENNLSETAFFVPSPERGAPRNGYPERSANDFDIRWFTPAAEIDLCGHATLASAFVLFHWLDPTRTSVTFHSKSGPLVVEKGGELLAMEFPSRPAGECEAPLALEQALGARPAATLMSRDLLAVYETEEEVRALHPDFARVVALGTHAVIVTAPGRDCDFVSRFFAPAVGVPEDPVTGSAHCTLIPYWARRLGKRTLHARQVSARGGELFCEDLGERVIIAGRAAPYLEGTIALPD
jgi:PhzF family phenazine biosynthesis protein